MADWLNSLHGTDGERGSHITTSAAAPDNTLDPVAGDVHFEVVSAERFRLYVFATAGWNVIYTTPAGALVGDGTITNEKLTADVKVGSLSAAQNAYPAPDRAQLTTVEKFLVWLGGNVTNLVTGLASLTSRVGALEARPTGSGGGGGSGFTPTTSGDGTKYLSDNGGYKAVAAGTSITTEQNLSSNSTTGVPSVAAVRSAVEGVVNNKQFSLSVSQTKTRLPIFFSKKVLLAEHRTNYNVASVTYSFSYYDQNGDETKFGPFNSFNGASGINAAINSLTDSVVANFGYTVYLDFSLKAGRSSAESTLLFQPVV